MNHSAASTALLAPPPLLANGHALLLDFDGTLVELADRPDGVVIDTTLIQLLCRLVGTFGGRIALVSGRSVAQIEDFLDGRVPGLAIVGSHGAELRLGDRRITPDRPRALVAAERAVTEAFGGAAGVVIEVKSFGVAVHYRMAPRHAAEAHRIVARFAGRDGLVQQDGKMMVELRSGGQDKGSGITNLLTHAPFLGSIPIFAGDDVTDEAGLAVVDAHGGIGVLVGASRATAARYNLPDVAAVRAWLATAT